jgi:hypothetical protein
MNEADERSRGKKDDIGCKWSQANDVHVGLL